MPEDVCTHIHVQYRILLQLNTWHLSYYEQKLSIIQTDIALWRHHHIHNTTFTYTAAMPDVNKKPYIYRVAQNKAQRLDAI